MQENIVKKVCKELGITQKELAEMLEVQPSAVSNWSSGKIPKMAKIALECMLENKKCKEKRGSGDFDFIDYLKSKGFMINKFSLKEKENCTKYKITFYKTH